MGNLPVSPVMLPRLFKNIGIDYFGPISIQEGTMHKIMFVRAYRAVLICFSTKTLHIELPNTKSADNKIV